VTIVVHGYIGDNTGALLAVVFCGTMTIAGQNNSTEQLLLAKFIVDYSRGHPESSKPFHGKDSTG
jgi:hypothetical protein